MRCIIIGNAHRMGEAIALALEHAGHTVRLEPSLQDALNVLLYDPHDVALIDCLTFVSGQRELIATLRKICPDIQTIMILGSGQDPELAEGAGADYSIERPFPTAVLIAILARCKKGQSNHNGA